MTATRKAALPSAPARKVDFLWSGGSAGAAHNNGPKKGQPIPLRQAGVGSFAVLTTRFPEEDREEDRRIFGLFRIDKIEGNSVRSLDGGVRLPAEEAKELSFWAYCNNESEKPLWKEGLFRYLDDGQVHRILADVALTARDDGTKEKVRLLIMQAFGEVEPPKAAGFCPNKFQSVRRSHRAQKIWAGRRRRGSQTY